MSAIQSQFAATPEPPYYAVIFSSQRTAGDRGYGQMAERMAQLAAQQPGFLGIETVRGTDGFGITVSYWTSEEAITAWRMHLEHQTAQAAGKRVWYADYELRVARVERAYGKRRSPAAAPELAIRRDDLSGPEIVALLKEHWESLVDLTPPKSCHVLSLEALRQPNITFWSVWAGRELAGCGALKEWDPEHGEIKSMRTATSHRRQGVASALLAHILEEAKRRGYRRLSLETGVMPYFEPARSLYRKFGFQVCPPFGAYVADPNTVFMAKDL